MSGHFIYIVIFIFIFIFIFILVFIQSYVRFRFAPHVCSFPLLVVFPLSVSFLFFVIFPLRYRRSLFDVPIAYDCHVGT